MTSSVLVVDDDRLMVRTLCDVLRRRGFEVEGAHSGAEAVARSEQRDWSLVLMDIRMEGMTGVDAVKEMRRTHPGQQVILMTAYSAPELMAEAAQAGISRVLAKPFGLPQLLATIDSVLNARGA